MIKTDAIVIGGGATGCGIARDLVLRGLPHCLIEKGNFAAGAMKLILGFGETLTGRLLLYDGSKMRFREM